MAIILHRLFYIAERNHRLVRVTVSSTGRAGRNKYVMKKEKSVYLYAFKAK